MNPRQVMLASEVFDDVPVILCATDVRDTKKTNHFFFCNEGGTWTESAVRVWQNSWQARVLLHGVHGTSLVFSAEYRPEQTKTSKGDTQIS